MFKVLSTLDTSKSTGPDGIGPRILKCCALALFEPLHYLYTLCLSQGTIPREWCLHRITPIMKSGDRSFIKNYRPISILCTGSLVLEHLVFDRISDHLLYQRHSLVSEKAILLLSSSFCLSLISWLPLMTRSMLMQCTWTLGKPLTASFTRNFLVNLSNMESLVLVQKLFNFEIPVCVY